MVLVKRKKPHELRHWLSSRDVARHYGIDVSHVLYATRRGLIPAHKVGWNWLYKRKELPEKWPIRIRLLS